LPAATKLVTLLFVSQFFAAYSCMQHHRKLLNRIIYWKPEAFHGGQLAFCFSLYGTPGAPVSRHFRLSSMHRPPLPWQR
jgi:hypothetical protein